MKFLVMIITLSLASACYADQYLCVANQGAGLRYDKSKGKWVSAIFNVANIKHIITSNLPDSLYEKKTVKYIVKDFGRNDPGLIELLYCENDFNPEGYLYCEGIFEELKFNKNNGLYILYNDFCYDNVTPNDSTLISIDEKSETPHIEIGKCTSF